MFLNQRSSDGKIVRVELDITPEQMQNYNDGMDAQEAFPNLTPCEREYIISGITPEKWSEFFGGCAQQCDSCPYDVKRISRYQ
jgi:hypothetical protein